jgi:tRNA1(Val) A37 N6-methylase TrmN6
VRYRPGKPVKRVLVEFSLNTVSAAEADELVLHETDGTFTPSFRALISDLELHA